MSNKKDKQRKHKMVVLSENAIEAGLKIVKNNINEYRSFSRMTEKAILKLGTAEEMKNILNKHKKEGF